MSDTHFKGRARSGFRSWLAIIFCALCSSAASAQVFSDDFSRATDPGPLAPWVAESGAWTVSGGLLAGGASAAQTYSFLHTEAGWTNYLVTARIRFSSAEAYGGGIGGRLNGCCGAHYAVWVNPSGPAQDGSSTLELLKFQTWTSYEYNNTTFQPIQQIAIPQMDTNWHTLQVSFLAEQIQVYYDSNLVISATDTESDPYASGGISVDDWNSNTNDLMFVDQIQVDLLPDPLAAATHDYSLASGSSLTIAPSGVLSNCTDSGVAPLSAVAVTQPARGSLVLNGNGGFTYVPPTNFVGVDSFTYAVSNGLNESSPATVAVDVTPSTNVFYDDFSRLPCADPFAPWVIGIGEWSIAQGVMTGQSTDSGDYADAYVPKTMQDFTIEGTFSLPAFSWACGLSGRLNPATGACYVANVYPESSPLGSNQLRLIKFHTWQTWSASFTPMALVNLPGVGTTNHTLKLDFYGNQIDVYYDGALVVHTADTNFDGTPFYRSGAFGVHMYDNYYQATFHSVKVSALPPVNTPPVLPSQGDIVLPSTSGLILTNTAMDSDLPANPLTYQLLSAPDGASIDTNGVIAWNPGPGQVPSTNLFITVVTDFNPAATNAQSLSATNSFQVTVLPAVSAPPPVIQSLQPCPTGGMAIVWSAMAGRTYRLQFKSDLGQTHWTDILPAVQASGSVCSVTNSPVSASQGYYRVLLAP